MWVWISIRARCTISCYKVCQWLAIGRGFSSCSPVSSTNKTDRHRNIVESGVKHDHKHTIKKNIILWVESAARVYTHLLFIGSNKYIHLAYSIISQLYYFNTVKKKRRKEIINRFIVDNKNWSSNGQHHNQLQHEPLLWLPLQTPKPNRK